MISCSNCGFTLTSCACSVNRYVVGCEDWLDDDNRSNEAYEPCEAQIMWEETR